MKCWLLKKHSFESFKLHILVLIFLEVLVVAGGVLSRPFRDKVELGYIVKQGKHYLVYWKTDAREQFTLEASDLRTAIQFAREELNLECAKDRLATYPLEFNWLKPSLGGITFYWKTTNFDFYNRLTFTSQDEAELFQTLVKDGAYSPSPIGHSLALLPIQKKLQ